MVPTVTRIPRMHGRPPITAGSWVIRSRTSMKEDGTARQRVEPASSGLRRRVQRGPGALWLHRLREVTAAFQPNGQHSPGRSATAARPTPAPSSPPWAARHPDDVWRVLLRFLRFGTAQRPGVQQRGRRPSRSLMLHPKSLRRHRLLQRLVRRHRRRLVGLGAIRS
jgi:hypothetical protein